MPKINLARKRELHPNQYGYREKVDQWQIALKDSNGEWHYVRYKKPISSRQRQLLSHISRYDHLYHGALSRIAATMGVTPKTVWKHTELLFKKFGVYNRFQLHAVAKQLAKNGTRRRSSNQVSMFGTSRCGTCGRGSELEPQTEALHPGAAPNIRRGVSKAA